MVDLHCTQLTEHLKRWLVPIGDSKTKVRQKTHQRYIRFDLNTQRHKYTKFRVLLCGYTGFGIVEFQVIVQMEGCFGFKDGPIDQMLYEPTIDHNRRSQNWCKIFISLQWDEEKDQILKWIVKRRKRKFREKETPLMVDLHCTQLTELKWDKKTHQRSIRYDLNTQIHKNHIKDTLDLTWIHQEKSRQIKLIKNGTVKNDD